MTAWFVLAGLLLIVGSMLAYGISGRQKKGQG